MTGVSHYGARYSDVALGLVLGWIGWGLAALILPFSFSLLAGATLGLVGATWLRHTLLPRGVMAVLDPLGIVVPLLILRHVAITLGLPIQPFTLIELLAFLLLYTAFLATAFDVIPVDLYRYGFRPVPVALISLALCLYALLSGHWIIALIAVAGQGLWLGGLGSSNYFDHVLHATLVPVTLVVLLSRLIGGVG